VLIAMNWLALAAVLPAVGVPSARGADEAAAAEKRLAEATRYLASDELEGRGAGTQGLDLAAEYIARQFAGDGLKTQLFEGKPFQKFDFATGIQIGKNNRLALIGPPLKPGGATQTIELTPGTDFTPLTISGAADFDVPLVFAGYGITGKAEKYDDYQGINASAKAVILLRHEPRQDDPKSVFNGARDSQYAPMPYKVDNAQQHKAWAVIFCTDELDIRKHLADCRREWHEAIDRLAAEHGRLKNVANPAPEEIEAQCRRIDELAHQVEAAGKKITEQCDPLLPPYQGSGQGRKGVPVLHCRRAAVDRALRAALGADLAALERQIDQGPAPHSKELSGWRAVGRTDVRGGQVELKNVVAVLEGSGPTAEETIIVGAHYDHLGRGGRGSLDGKKTVHPGADDNASGTAVLMEVARSLALRHERLPRRIVFVAFAGEELGILGSNHYVRHPLVPLEKTVAMVNLDMVGRLRDDNVQVMGSTSGKQFAELLDKLGRREGLTLNRLPGGPGPSDQTPFYNHGVPVIHFFTGLHTDYHRTSDTAEKLNAAGMRRVARLTEETVVELARSPARPEYAKVSGGWLSALFAGNRPVFGIVPAAGPGGAGCVAGEILKDGPAQRAGLRSGDVIAEFDGKKIGGVEDFREALRKHKLGDRVKITVRRGNETLTLEVKLDAS
jgi:hypothetical protein